MNSTRQITERPTPTDLEVVKAFTSPSALVDLFTWLNDRDFIAEPQDRTPLFEEFGLAAQLGCVESRLISTGVS